MASVIVNKDGELYGGFETERAKPIWFKTKRAECVLEDSVAAVDEPFKKSSESPEQKRGAAGVAVI